MSYPYNQGGHQNQPPLQYSPPMMQMPPMQMPPMMPMYGHQTPHGAQMPSQMPVYMPPHMVPGQGHPPPQMAPHQPHPPPHLLHLQHQQQHQQQQQPHEQNQSQQQAISDKERAYARKCKRTEREIQALTAETIEVQEDWLKATEILQRIATENSLIVAQIAAVDNLREAPATNYRTTKKDNDLFEMAYGGNFHDPGR